MGLAEYLCAFMVVLQRNYYIVIECHYTIKHSNTDGQIYDENVWADIYFDYFTVF